MWNWSLWLRNVKTVTVPCCWSMVDDQSHMTAAQICLATERETCHSCVHPWRPSELGFSHMNFFVLLAFSHSIHLYIHIVLFTYMLSLSGLQIQPHWLPSLNTHYLLCFLRNEHWAPCKLFFTVGQPFHAVTWCTYLPDSEGRGQPLSTNSFPYTNCFVREINWFSVTGQAVTPVGCAA